MRRPTTTPRTTPRGFPRPGWIAVLAGLTSLLAAGGALASSSRPAPGPTVPLLGGGAAGGEQVDPLAPFRMRLGERIDEIAARLPRSEQQSLRSGDTTYVRIETPTPDDAGERDALPAPEGMIVVDGDFWFDADGALIEASLVLEMETETALVVDELVGWLGHPDFEVVLPGGLDMLVGWRSGEGYLLGSFSDMPVFQLSAFRHEPDDLLAGSHLVLYRGLSDYSDGLAAGEAPSVLLRELLSVVSWVENARQSIESSP